MKFNYRNGYWKAARVAAIFFVVISAPNSIRAEQLTEKTRQAFDQYIARTEETQNRALAVKASLLWIDGKSEPAKGEAYEGLRRGEVLVQDNCGVETRNCNSVPGGMIQDWSGIVFVPRVSLSEVLTVLQDYGRDKIYYPSEVMQSRLEARNGNDFHVFLRLRRSEVITVVFNTEYDIRYLQVDANRVFARSHSTRIAEVDRPGTAQEREEQVGNDHGFLWRLNSYWYFRAADGGVYVQCEGISLTRNAPVGLGWLVDSFIKKIPADSLRASLAETRRALAQGTKGADPQ